MVRVQPEGQEKATPERLQREYKSASAKYLQSLSKSISHRAWLMRIVIHPESIPRLTWDIVILSLIVYEAITVPYFICFNDQYTYELNIMEFVINLMFIVDIVANFNTGYYEKGTLITQHKLIAIDYIKFWFWVDFLATFPYDWLIQGVSFDPSVIDASTASASKTTRVLRIARIFRFLRILRLLRIAKLKKILIKIEDYLASNTLAMICFIAHWTACFWFLIGYQESSSHPITWVTAAGILDASSYEQYLTSLYWAFTTIATVGYGDITPIILEEKLFAMMTMIMSSGVFAYTVGSIGSLISKTTALESTYREQVVAVNSYMKKKSLPKSLQFRVRRYLDYIWEVKKKKKLDEKQVLSLLSEPLRDEIYAHINANVIKLCAVFDDYESYFIAQLTRTLENETYAPGDTIFEDGEISSKIYFIMNGTIEIYHQSTLSMFASLSGKQYFGEIAFFTGVARCASARCVEFADMLSLVRLNFLSLLEKFPEAKELTNILQKRCEGLDYTVLSIKCYICEELGHVAARCRNFLVNLEQEETRNLWLTNRESVKLVGKDFDKLKRFQRKERKRVKKRVIGRNVIGVPRPKYRLFPNSAELFPVIHDIADTFGQSDSGTSTRATNKDCRPVAHKEREKLGMFYISSEPGEDKASSQFRDED
jgi:hypothetical protein